MLSPRAVISEYMSQELECVLRRDAAALQAVETAITKCFPLCKFKQTLGSPVQKTQRLIPLLMTSNMKVSEGQEVKQGFSFSGQESLVTQDSTSSIKTRASEVLAPPTRYLLYTELELTEFCLKRLLLLRPH